METSEILKQAIEKNLCKPWQEKMISDSSVKNLCEMYFMGDDWSMENDFPSLNVLREFKGQSEVYGLFTDYTGMPNNLPKAAFFGNSNVQMTYTDFNVSQLILRHNTKAKVRVVDNAFVIINLLDNAELDIESFDNSRVEVFCYGNQNIKSIGDVRIHKSSFKK
ncbi:hypothetical protein CEY12_06210 [Chryseobacterium sp. T16E-39]|uniref:hypothetical protein n=1 Tax=Chryseobacterium sp. T16E-39 TaxID=2015076 RepID=UPI000B5B1817|nr:hypothetical protein [Chryseobacterium sp. T16E-39]ASK29722.1 hypothetical protein CEY12_06210 [Chryseobacterium sp. T16E-39]